MKKNINSPESASSISLGANILLTLGKLIGGIIAHSQALISDGINSLDDIISTVVVMIGVKSSTKKADENHPFGHERMDNVAAIILSIFFFITGIGIIVVGGASLLRALRGEIELSLPNKLAWIVAGIAMAIKEGLFLYTFRIGRKSRSSAIQGLAMDHQMDVISTGVALIGIVLAIVLDLPWIDPLAAIITGLLIIVTGIRTLYDAFNKMTDHAASEKTIEEIATTIIGVAGVVRIDDLRTRLFGSRIYVDVEIAVDANLSLRKAHAIAEEVHHQVEQSNVDIKHIMVHVNPDVGRGAYAKEDN
jgi:cation diffusion facilitator family transporter